MHTHMSLLHANHMLDRRLASFSSVSIGFLRLATRNSTPMHPSQHQCTSNHAAHTYAPMHPMHLTPHTNACTDATCTIMLVFVLVLALLLMLKSNLIYFTERGICLAF